MSGSENMPDGTIPTIPDDLLRTRVHGLSMQVAETRFDLKAPFAITGHVFEETRAVRVTLGKDGVAGRGEGDGVYYLGAGETCEGMTAALAAVAADVERGVSLADIQTLLPPGGARNALDCALWDYLAKASAKGIWRLLRMTPRPVTTVFTLGLAPPGAMAAGARAAAAFPTLKIKLDADNPVERLTAVREARPDAALIVDVNQGWTVDQLRAYAPALARLGVAMIEQPLPRGADAALETYRPPVPLGADESCLHMGDFALASKRYSVINIKLDKTGGLTEGLRLAAAARRAGLDLMVGNMVGSSLAMAPAHVIAQMCRHVDIDGPLLLRRDVAHGLAYGNDGRVDPPQAALWG
ncbi:dipeptide epimerase [Eilatimonas milleporae]|uniref:Dipeptide epimerase n=1 Tax=Eilatimonas milleporae TaxID=911205 RepID=A0A3M0CHD7_9PROT|nr:dipeptide epimerase [Eilatimonas milleporae]RMB08752.1 L-alanine-DL-glutamate epimerase-like enolase superfamily enzyme [Eilatimonas milleporae]